MSKNEELRKKAGFPENRKHINLVCFNVISECQAHRKTQVMPVNIDNFEQIPDCLETLIWDSRDTSGGLKPRIPEFYYLGGMPCGGSSYPEALFLGNTKENVKTFLEAHFNFGHKEAKEIIAATLQPK